jgi:hypothetical protein
MSDLWGGINANIQTASSGWLYQDGGDIRGPLPAEALGEKLTRGEISLEAKVAREGGEFHPITRVKAFQPYMGKAQKAASKNAAKKSRKVIVLLAVLVLGGGAAGGYFVMEDLKKAEQADKLKAEKARAELEAKRKENQKVGSLKLVALVSLGSAKEVKVRSSKSSGKKTKRKSSTRRGAPEEPEMVSECKLSAGQMVQTLQRHLAKINICVEDEKKRDKQNLLPNQIGLSFVVKPNGRTTEFAIENRHYRTGPMKNCMTKAFNLMRFPETTGSNCVFEIPIKIGN